MKKRFHLLASGLTAAVLLSLLPMHALAASVSADDAKAIALNDAGIKEENTAWLKVKSDTDDRRAIYEVKFFTNSYVEYDYDILASDGSILKIEYDAEAVIAGSQTSQNKTANKTLEGAKTIALTHAGLKADDVTFTKTKTDTDDGIQVYEIEFVTGDRSEYEFKIDAATGMILSWSYDAKKAVAETKASDARSSDTSSSEAKSSESKTGKPRTEKTKQEKTKTEKVKPDEKTKTRGTSAAADTDALADAKALALKTAGLTESQVTWGRVKQDYDDGRLIYEGKFFSGKLECEFEIDAASMTVIDWEVESIYD